MLYNPESARYNLDIPGHIALVLNTGSYKSYCSHTIIERSIMPKKILAVDDEKHIVRLVQINLVKEGYEVVTATNGREAVEAANAHNPDLIVMDVMMPEMDGFAALEKLKENPKTANIPVIMLTAKAQDADVFRGWQSGADLYLTKPFNPQELLTFVRRIFESQQDSPAEGYDITDGVYNLDDIESGDNPLILPPDEDK